MFADPPRGRTGWDLGRIGRRSFPSPKVTGGCFEDDRSSEVDGRRGAAEEGRGLAGRDSPDNGVRSEPTRGAREGVLGPRLGSSSPSLGVRPVGLEGMM